MMQQIAFAPEHLRMIAVQPGQLADWPDCAERDARAALFAAQEHAVSFLGEDGAVLACGGFVASHGQHLTAWSVLSELGPAQLGFVTRWCRGYLKGLDVRRIDMTVRAGFMPGHRWARLLGFGLEGWQRAFYADGEGMAVYAMIDGRPAGPSTRPCGAAQDERELVV